MLTLKVGDTIDRDTMLRQLVGMQYTRNDLAFTRGTFRVRGDTIEVIPQYEELAVQFEPFRTELTPALDEFPLCAAIPAKFLREDFVFDTRIFQPRLIIHDGGHQRFNASFWDAGPVSIHHDDVRHGSGHGVLSNSGAPAPPDL